MRNGGVSLELKTADRKKALDDMMATANQEYNEILSISEWINSPEQNVCVCCQGPYTYGSYHTHDFFEINYAYDGSCINLVDDKLIFMEKGDFVLMHPGTFHNLYATDQSQIFNFLIRPEWFYRTFCNRTLDSSPLSAFIAKAQDKDYYRYLVCTGSDLSLPQTLSHRLIEAGKQKSRQKYLMMEAIMTELFCSLICEEATLSPQTGSGSKTIMQILSYISENYNHLTMPELCTAVGYSKAHICRLFDSKLGKNFTDILTEIRIGHAKSYLLNTDLSVKEISFAVGYKSVEYFQRLFKKKLGCTPGQFKARHSR